MEYSAACVPVFTQRGAVAALEEGEDFIAQSKKRYQCGLEVVSTRLREYNHINFPIPNAAFYAYFQIDGVTDSMKFAKRIIDECNVGLAPGVAFDPNSKNWFRLCFANSPERLHKAFDQMASLLLNPWH